MAVVKTEQKAGARKPPIRTATAGAAPRKRIKKAGAGTPRPWAKILGWGGLVFLLFGSMLAVFLTIFFSVP